MESQNRLHCLIGSAAVAVSSILAMPAAQAAPTWPVKPDSAWQEVTATPDTVHLVNRVAQGAMHAVCSAERCAIFVQPASGCLPGTTYPLLVNSARRVGVVPSRCVLVQHRGRPSLMVHLQQSAPLLSAMVAGQDISIAFPTQAGAMSVLPIRMPGASELLAAGLRRIGKSPKSAAAPDSGAPAKRKSPTKAVTAGPSRYQV